MLFIINPLNAQIVFWTNQLNAITNILICDDQLMICHRNESNESPEAGDRLFTLLKVFDLDDFLENNVLRLSNLSLFVFLKENRNLIGRLFGDQLRSHVDNEWLKLEDDLKPIFSDIRQVLDDKSSENSDCPDRQSSFQSSTSFETHESTTTRNNSSEQAGSQTNGDAEIDLNRAIAAMQLNEPDRSKASADENSEANSETNSQQYDQQNGLSNGSATQKSIEQLTSKHRWKKSDEPVDESKVLQKKLATLKQSLDRNQINGLKCKKCSYPAPRAHQMMSSKQKEIRLILIKLMKDDSRLDEILDACFELAIWNLYMDLLIIKRSYGDYIRTALQLMDLNLVSKNNLFVQIFRSDLNLARQLLDLFVRQHLGQDPNKPTGKAICLHCEASLDVDHIKWPDMIEFLQKNLKLDDLISLLMVHHQHMPTSALPPKLCIQLLQTEIIKQYENPATNEELARLNQQLAKIKKSKQTTDGSAQAKNDWCMHLDLSQKNCDICTKPLKGCRKPLLVFKCDHVYHKDCDETNSKRACYVCSINRK